MAWNSLHPPSNTFSYNNNIISNDVDDEKEHVEHNYHDHSKDRDLPEFLPGISYHLFPYISGGKGTDQTFPMKLHTMLENIEKDGLASIVSWQPHGRCFVVHKQDEFVAHILPRWFRQSKFPSFQRQLNMYGFKRITAGRDKGGYYHELFLRNRRFLCLRIQRLKLKGTGVRKPSSPATEPDFYRMSFLPQLGGEEKQKAQQKKNMVIVDPFLQSMPTSAGAIPRFQRPTGMIEPSQIQKSTCVAPLKPAESFTRPERVQAPACWSFCEPTPIAQGFKPLPRYAASPCPSTNEVSKKDFMPSKALPPPPKTSVSDALFIPFKQAASKNTQTSPPKYTTPTVSNKESDDSSISPEDDLDCKFDFDAALESLLKVPTLSGPSEDFAS